MVREGFHRGLYLSAPAINSNVTTMNGNAWIGDTSNVSASTSISTNDNVVVAGYRLLSISPIQTDLMTRGVIYKSSTASGTLLNTGTARIGRARSTNTLVMVLIGHSWDQFVKCCTLQEV
jgi:hypothetical protein